MTNFDKKEAWFIDQLAKSQLFQQKLHQWQMLEIAKQLEQIQAENMDWTLESLAISKKAWNKVIHRGIKPILVFAHPQILVDIINSTSYYRMLAMVSQKSMNQVGLSTISYEQGKIPKESIAILIAKHLNKIISYLVEADPKIDIRKFDLWRGMAAGTQAQGSWQNLKGEQTEYLIKGIIERHLDQQNLIDRKLSNENELILTDGRIIIFSDEPDIAIYENQIIQIAIEIKGGIDPAGVLERIGTAIKSLSRTKEENRNAVTILILHKISLSQQGKNVLEINQNNVNYWLTIEDVLNQEESSQYFLKLLNLT